MADCPHVVRCRPCRPVASIGAHYWGRKSRHLLRVALPRDQVHVSRGMRQPIRDVAVSHSSGKELLFSGQIREGVLDVDSCEYPSFLVLVCARPETLSWGDSLVFDRDLAVEFVFKGKARRVCQSQERVAFLEKYTVLCELDELTFPYRDLVVSRGNH